MSQPIKLYYANCTQKYDNCYYPNEIDITNIDDIKKAVSKDYVCAKYKNNYRCIDNFIKANAVGGDFDNDHSEDPNEWITSKSIDKMFHGVPYLLHYSKSHMKVKIGAKKTEYGPRPRIHVVFLIDEITDVNAYITLKQKLSNFCPLLDTNAMDAARFLAGTENPQVEFHPGTIPLNQYLDEVYSEKAFEEYCETIPEGSRNHTMHKIACSLIVRYGLSEEAKEKYREASTHCSPPLENAELNTIWKSVAKFYKAKVVTNPKYKNPEEFNAPVEIKWDDPIPFEKTKLPTFPVDALPKKIGDYVVAVSETTQTPVDMPATASLSILALCLQGRYRVQAKPD